MKRSAVNRSIASAIGFFAERNFALPPFAHWTPEDWRDRVAETREIREWKLGWDVTDFGSGRFASVGLTVFTLRNHRYAEKIMLLEEEQTVPFHYHRKKCEDIINRGGEENGRLLVQLYPRSEWDDFAASPVRVMVDGIWQEHEAGATIGLGPGESITIPPLLFHAFHPVNGAALVGEVSTLNDDEGDNVFYEKVVRFPKITEDERPLHLLCNEYP